MPTATTAERVAAVAYSIIVSEGSEAASMRRIAAEVGVTPMTIYRHYANRDDLLETVAASAFGEVAQGWAQRHPASANADNIDALIGEAVDEYVDLALSQPFLYSFLFAESRVRARRFPEDFEAGRSPTLNVLAALLIEGVRVGRFRHSDEWELAIIIAATLHGLVQLRFGARIGLSEEQFRRLCRAAVERILDGVRI